MAFLYGITEVNPSPVHFYCEKCHHFEVAKDVSTEYNLSGWDYDDQKCPKCGQKMWKAGFNIPFETFLGFNGGKEPDIDTNFSGEVQGEIFRYVAERFGENSILRARFFYSRKQGEYLLYYTQRLGQGGASKMLQPYR